PPLLVPAEVLGVVLLVQLSSTKVSSLIEKISDPKDLKKLLRTRNNVLVLYSKSEAAAESHLRLLSTVAQAVKGQGTICWVDCGYETKVCIFTTILKVNAFFSSFDRDGAFHTEYNRAVTFKSIVAFLKDPKGPPLWEEDPGAKDVVHIDSEKVIYSPSILPAPPDLNVHLYPWVPYLLGCGMCKRIMPHFQKAATQLRGHFVLAGMNVYPSEFENIKEEYNVRGYPTICYFEKGRFLFQYDNYGSTAEDIVEWLKNPQPPQPQAPETPWADEGGSVYHLTDEDFDQFVKEHSSVLVMFHAPCEKYSLRKRNPRTNVLTSPIKVLVCFLMYHILLFVTLEHLCGGKERAEQSLHQEKGIWKWQARSLCLSYHTSSPMGATGMYSCFHECLFPVQATVNPSPSPTGCPHCKKVIPHFTTTADVFKDDRKIACAAVDCVKEKNQDLCQQEAVKAYPTFHYYHYGKFAEKYDSDRTELGFTNFIRTLREGDHERLGKKKEEL
uniref:Thioredoxin domain-containing protein n=1 Tax=Ailuropoda melanoleuca TaxID=9646 RepID=G1LDS5_AILME